MLIDRMVFQLETYIPGLLAKLHRTCFLGYQVLFISLDHDLPQTSKVLPKESILRACRLSTEEKDPCSCSTGEQ
jgi:hypothetical protein